MERMVPRVLIRCFIPYITMVFSPSTHGKCMRITMDRLPSVLRVVYIVLSGPKYIVYILVVDGYNYVGVWLMHAVLP